MQKSIAGLKTAFVFDWLTSFGGGEQVLLALRQLFPEAPIYTSVYNASALPQLAEARVIPSYLQHIPTAKRRHQLFIPLMPAAFESFNLKGYDLVISIGNGFAKGVITQPGQFHLTYCQTPPRYLWNLGDDDRNQHRFDSGLRAWAEHRLRIWDVVSAERPDLIIANSQTVAERITKIYRRESTVIYPPVDVERFLPIANPEADYYLSVGRLVAYKRVDLLIRACLAIGMPLLIVGEGPERARLERLAGNAPHIRFLGRQPVSELEKLYANARAFLFAAEEDFGIVPVEAMSAGRPVIAYGRGGLTESISSGKTGLFFSEQTVESLLSVLADFDPEQFNSRVIRAQAERFSTSRFLTEMQSAIQRGLAV